MNLLIMVTNANVKNNKKNSKSLAFKKKNLVHKLIKMYTFLTQFPPPQKKINKYIFIHFFF